MKISLLPVMLHFISKDFRAIKKMETRNNSYLSKNIITHHNNEDVNKGGHTSRCS